MKYLAFHTAVAVQAAAFICNYAVAQNLKLTVEHVAPHVVELPAEITESQQQIIGAVAEKFDGYLTDEIPSPLNFFNPQKIMRRKSTGEYSYDITTRGERDRTLDTGKRRRVSSSRTTDRIRLPANG